MLVQHAWQAQLLSLVVGLVAVIGIPARMALRASVLTPERLKASTGSIVAAERLGLVLGPLVALVVTVTISVQAAFVLEFLLGLVATVSLLRLEPGLDNRDTPHDDIRGGYRRAWQLMRSSRVVWEYSLTGFTYSVGTGIRRLLFRPSWSPPWIAARTASVSSWGRWPWAASSAASSRPGSDQRSSIGTTSCNPVWR